MERVVKAGDENDCYFAFAYLAFTTRSIRSYALSG